MQRCLALQEFCSKFLFLICMYDDATFSGGGGGLGRAVPLDVGDIEKEGGPQGRVVRVDFGRHCPWILDEVELCFAHEHSI